MSIVFGVTGSKQLLELAGKANGGYKGERTVMFVSTKEQQIMLHRAGNPVYKNEALFTSTKPHEIVPSGKIFNTMNMHEMECMKPENWTSFSGSRTEYLDISDYPLLGSISEIPKAIKCQLSRETDTIQLTVSADFGNGRQIVFMMDPGVAIINLFGTAGIMFPGNLPKSTLVNDMVVNILPDERSEKVGNLLKGDFVVVLNKENIYDDETGVEWSLVKNLDSVYGWIPTAAISDHAAIFGEAVVDVAEYVDATISSSWRIGDISDVQRETFEAIMVSLMASIVKSMFEKDYDKIVQMANSSK